MRESTARRPGTYRSSLYGPEPITSRSGSRRRAGNTRRGTIAPAVWVSTDGQVASAWRRCIVTVRPLTSTRLRLWSSVDGPVGSAMAITRSSENFTSAAVSRSPLEKRSPLRRVQTYVFAVRKAQRRAASGLGRLPPGGMLSRVWNTLPISCWEPKS